MLTREALASLGAAIEALPSTSVRLPERPGSAKAIEALGAPEAAAPMIASDSLDALRIRLERIFGSVRDDQAATRSDLRDAPWLLWAEDRPLANLPRLLETVWSQAIRSKVTRRNLIEAWIRNFALDRPRIKEGGASIRQVLLSNPNPRFDFWQKADQRLALFDPQLGPRKLASWLVYGPESVDHILNSTGFDDPLRAVGGYMRSVQEIVLRDASSALRTQSGRGALMRMMNFLAPAEALRFAEPKSCGEIARGLLAAWLDSGGQPDDAVREGVRTFLLRKLADPRLRPENWTPAGEAATNLMRQWLARASLKAFFELIAEHALDTHWKHRAAFWTACLDHGGIDDAWLALGSRVHASARSVRELEGAYARLEGAGVAGQQSILLLKVRNIVFCEWSHNGKLRAWLANGNGAPHLNQPNYTREDVTQLGLAFPPNPRFGARGAPDGAGLSHIHSDRNYWQSSAAELLSRRTGITLSPADWRPR